MARKKFDLDKLKDTKTRNDFNIMLRNKFNILRNLELENNIQVTSIDKKWVGGGVSNIYIETIENVLDIGKNNGVRLDNT